MATYTGLSLRLKDKHTSVPDKLKLAKFAWVTDAVHIPNKQQQILDFVCGLLVNKKKHNLQETDCVLIWSTLDKFLNVADSSVILKPSILQAVIEDLSLFIPKEKLHSWTVSDNERVSFVIKCCQQLLSLPTVVASQFDNLCHLLSVVCHLMVQPGPDPMIFADLQDLSESVVAVLVHAQKLHLNQHQVLHTITDRVLNVALKLMNKTNYKNLQEFVLGCLLHPDLQETYSVYLKHVMGEAGQGHIKQAPKSIGNMFSVLLASVTKNESSSTATVFLPAFVGTFVRQNKSDPRLCFLLLKHIVQMLTETKGDDVPSTQSKTMNLKDKAVAECVSASQDCDLFRANNTSGDVQKWFSQLTEQIAEKDRLPAWFIYMRAVLNLNHLVIEKNWERILTVGLVQTDQTPEESHEAQDLFLADLISTYLKLRRTSDLLSALFSTVEVSAYSLVVFQHLPKFYNRLCYMFSEMPLASLLEVWEKIQTLSVKLKDQLKQKTKDSTNLIPCLQWTLSFYTVLLGNARLFDHRRVGNFGQKVEILVNQLEENVLMPLHKKKEIVTECPALNELLSTWTMVKILLFPKWRERPDGISEEGHEEGNVSQLLKKANQTVQARLALQRKQLASVTQIHSVMEPAQSQATVEKVVERLLDFPPLTRDVAFRVWKGRTDVMTALDQPVCQFQQLRQLFPLISCRLTDVLIQKCVDIVIDILSLCTEDDTELFSSDGSSLVIEVVQFLAHPATREVKIFQEKLSQGIWKVLLKGISQKNNSPKKKKRKTEPMAGSLSTLSRIATFLTATEIQADKRLFCIADIKEADIKVFPHFPVLLRILGQLDLEYVSTLNLTSQIGLLVLLSALKGTEGLGQGDFRKQTEQLLVRCLSFSKMSDLFKCVEPTDLLDFVLMLSSKRSETDYQLLEVTTQAVMNDRDAVLSMTAFSKKLVLNLSSDETGDHVRMKTVALMIRNCHKYVTKSFHIPEIGEAAREIFFCLAKFVIKNGLNWFQNAKLAYQRTRGNTLNKSKQSVGGIKRKLSEELIEEKNFKESSSELMLTSAESTHRAWCALCQCVTELLDLWSHNAVDGKFNDSLTSLVTDLMQSILTDFTGEHHTCQQVRQTQYEFIRAVCCCHLRCSQSPGEPVTSSQLLSPSSLIDQTSPISKLKKISSSISVGLSLLPEGKLEEIWTVCFDLALAEFSGALGKDEKWEEQKTLAPNSKKSQQAEKKKVADVEQTAILSHGDDKSSFGHSKDYAKKPLPNVTALKSVISFKASETGGELGRKDLYCHESSKSDHWSMDKMELWPKSLSGCVDVLTAVMEASNTHLFQLFLEKMCESLVPSSDVDIATVFVVIAVWRRLIKSNLLSDDLVKELFRNMYRFLAAIIGIVEYFENFQKSRLQLASKTKHLMPHETPVVAASRFILEGISDFIDLGKAFITPRMTLLCLHAGVAFTLTSPSDLEAMYRLTNTVLVHHTNTALTAVPTILCLANKLIASCVTLGSEENVKNQPEVLKDVTNGAQLITRLLTLLSSSTYKTDLAKVAHSVIAEYVIDIQRETIHTAVKRELVRGLYKLMNVCDKYRLAALNASLPAGVKDTFKFFHQDYEKYHRYTGAV